MKTYRIGISVLALLVLAKPAAAYICDNSQFFEMCPQTDPVYATIIADFKIRKDGTLINPATITCTPPISAIPIAQYTDELVLLQALRAIYYMDLGRSNDLPWSASNLYSWLKAGIGGFNISTTASNDQYVGAVFPGDPASYFIIRAKSDAVRDLQRQWAPGPAGIYSLVSLMMHERRHADGIAHVRCCPAQDPANTNDACDQTYEETTNISPYAIQYWLEKNWITGFINTGVGCLSPVPKTTAITNMRQEANIHLSNFCTNAPPPLADANNPPGGCTCTGLDGSSSGEPHLTTLDGLRYDFQAAGDFLLLEDGPSFVVQVRQRFTPNRPNVAFNKAAAVRFGKTRVAVFVEPTRLVVNGAEVALADGESLSFANNVQVSRENNAYVIRHANAETIRVVAVDSVWVQILGGQFVDVSLSLNHAAYGTMRGLLGNGDGDVRDDFMMRDGKVLAIPISFDDVYKRFGASMSVDVEESLFREERKPPNPNAFEAPTKPFTVKDLAADERQVARNACLKAGVKDGRLLDDCALDVAVLHSPALAKLYTGVAAPAAVLEPNGTIRQRPKPVCECGEEKRPDKDKDHDRKKK